MPEDRIRVGARPQGASRSYRRLILSGLVVMIGAGLLATGRGLTARSQAPPFVQKDEVSSIVRAQPEPPSSSPTAGMVWIPGGTFRRGSDDEPDARPVREVVVDGFWMDRTEVTNAEFAEFVRATGYVTVAERAPDPSQFPGAPAELLVPGSIVFSPPAGPVDLGQPLSWWRYQSGANWRHPEGPGSSIEGRENHPVVHIAWEDAAAYARWAGKRLPTEAEWEYAARGGLDAKPYVWGDELRPGGRWAANIWQGQFPTHNTAEDGYRTTSPVGSFPPNGFGLYDMAGNAWEWCADWYRPDAYATGPLHNPRGPDSSFDPDEPEIPKRVLRGGSFMCSEQYCSRYRLGTRGKGAPDSGAYHIGFRCVRSGPAPTEATHDQVAAEPSTPKPVASRPCCGPGPVLRGPTPAGASGRIANSGRRAAL